MRWGWLFLGLMGCADAPYGPSRAVNDPLLGALPANTTLIVGGDWATLRARPLTEDLLTQLGVDRVGLGEAIAARTGLADGLAAPAQGALGCGPTGCVALLEGDFASLDLAGFGAQAHSAGLLVRGDARSTTLRTAPRGRLAAAAPGRIEVRRLSPSKAVLGEVRAVRALRQARAAGAPGFDTTQLEGLIPRGELFAVVVDPVASLNAVAERVARAEADAAEAWEAQALRTLSAWSGVQAVAVAVELGDSPTLRGRARCDSALSAGGLAWAVRERLAGAAEIEDEGGRLAARAVVHQRGVWVEVEAPLEPERLAALIDEVPR